ncbi:hypothetical protein Q5O24_00885 [Eubacteriaceae bacterium ES3]|nr:hypothetical protein Q5O24_00885 [Eubacteriaceae bacterium ES3]
MNNLKSPLLSQFLNAELKDGNTIDKVENGWSKMDTVIRLKNPLNKKRMLKLLTDHPDTLGSFTSNDPHYPKEAGLIHDRESVVGPFK